MRLWPWRNERRYFKRLDTDLPAVFRVQGADESSLTPPQEARVINLTHEGCCLALRRLDLAGFHLHRCLEEPARHLLYLNILPIEGGTWRVSAQVRWINRDFSGPGGEFRMGVAFQPGQELGRSWRRLAVVK